MHGLLNLAPDELASLGYTDLSHVSETETFRLYHARTHDKQNVLIKAPVSARPSAKLIQQLERELEISSGLNPDYVVRPHKIERCKKLTALILDDCPYPPLTAWLNEPLQVAQFLTLAMGITSALMKVHHQGLVHRDITPENIFVDSEGKAKLSGFGTACRLSRERQAPAQPEQIAGTLAYMAPEQTGRMNRSIDTRSDLYALGIVFYQMLTGQLPFNASDPMEWVHCHIAVQPKPPSECLSTIPSQLSKIVMKLLSKDAEHRYQTAEGLGLDLKQCLDGWHERSSIAPFELGKMDIPSQLLIPEKLYGRESELKSLISAVYRVVAGGSTELLLLSGYAGVGKSALISEMRKSLVSPNILFAQGKLDQYKRDTPYDIFAQALQSLVHQILGKRKDEIAQWRDDLNKALKPNGRLITDLVPDLVRLIGEQPAVAGAPPQEAQNRFNHVIRRMIEVFARPQHPLVLFLDDLQWIDNASLELLQHLLNHSGAKHLLLLGAYRDHEVGQTHPLRRTIEVIRKRGARLSEITLKPLLTDDLCQLIADALHTDTGRALPLAVLVQEKTDGNPFFVTRFLASLADEKLLVFDPKVKEWNWDLQTIHARDYSENVTDLMIGKLSSLSGETQEALKQLAATKQMYQTLVDNLPDSIARFDTDGRPLFFNATAEKTFGIDHENFHERSLIETQKPGNDEQTKRILQSIKRVAERGKTEVIEAQWDTLQGKRTFEVQHIPEVDARGDINSVLSIAHDITEIKQGEKKVREHFQFLQSLDRLNQLLHAEGDIEQIMNRALQEVLDIFDCDRAYLIYPCDPDSKSWSVPIESTRPEFPGAGRQGPQPMDEDISAFMRALLETNHPLQIGPDSRFPITEIARKKFNTRSVLAMMLRPRIDKPWQFGIQQCSHERTWNSQELRLFEEIGHRLSDSLNSLLISRNLRESEERFRLVFENSPVSIQEEDYSAVKAHLESIRPLFGDDLAGYLVENPDLLKECAALVRMVDINHAALTLHEAKSKEEMLHGLPRIFLPETLEDFREILLSLMSGKTSTRRESVLQTLNGRRYHVDAFFSVCPGYEENLGKVFVSLIDITELKQAEQERQEHLHFLESLDRINQVLQAEGDMEEILGRTLDVVLDIFDCDRAYLQYPCDPDAAAEWRLPIQSNKPDYLPTLQTGGHVPYHPHIEETLRALLETDTSIRLGPDTDRPIPPEITDNLGVRSMMAVALHPKVDRPWHFGIHQCSHDRIWTDQEARLLEEIGHRFSDGLNNLLVTHDLRESEERFRLVYQNSPVPIWEEDFSAVKSILDELKGRCAGDLEAYLLAHPETVRECAALVRVVNINSAVLELHEADSKEALYEGLPKTFIPESYTAFREELIAIARGETELHMDSAVQTLSGKRREVSVSFSVCPGYEQSLSKVFVSLFDITQRKRDEDQLRLAASVFSTSQEGILISDADNRIIDVNPAFCRLTGYSREEALGQNPGFLGSDRQSKAFYADMWQSINSKGEWQGEIWNQRKSGDLYPELLSIVAVKDDRGQLQHYVGAFSDISMIKQHEADLDRIAHYDMLTSVPNRRLLGDRLEQALAHTRRHGRNLAVCYLDLDGFKPINDQYGHEGGDRMLIEIARRLESMSRGEDTVARLGGDEFVLLWNDIGSEADCARALERILDKVSEPMLLEDEPVSVSASIGVTLFPDDDVDADSLLRHADHAMYTAKQLGKNRYQIFDARLERQISAQAELMAMVARGLDRNQFELYYQPKVDYTAKKVIGIEALLRWNDPVLGLLGPREFLSLIENDTLAFRMGRWVMEEALRQAKRWDEQGIKLPISINIFPRHLKSRTFIDDLRNAIDLHWPQMPKNRLLMEIIETSDLEELTPIEAVIKECLSMGIGFSLDDFGTGYSSLVYLRQLSIEELKIDQSFVRDMLEDPEDEAIVVGVISLGQAFGLRVVAEGVESERQAQYLVDLGSNIVQGYGVGRPMPLHAFQKWYAYYMENELELCQN